MYGLSASEQVQVLVPAWVLPSLRASEQGKVRVWEPLRVQGQVLVRELVRVWVWGQHPMCSYILHFRQAFCRNSDKMA